MKFRLKVIRNILNKGIYLSFLRNKFSQTEINFDINLTGCIIYNNSYNICGEIVKSTDEIFTCRWKNPGEGFLKCNFRNSYLINTDSFILINIPNNTIKKYIDRIKNYKNSEKEMYYEFTDKDKEEIEKYLKGI